MPSILPNLEGPVRKPASGGPALSLVVFLHGFGADGDDLIGLAPYWAPLLPDTEFLSPHAPYPCEMAPFGRQWFSLQSHAPESMLAGARATAPLIDAFLDDTLVARNLDESRLALVGFSQGTMMSLYVGLRRAKPLAAIIGYSGALLGAETLAGEIRSRPPVLLVHGDADPIVPVSALPHAVRALEAAGVEVEELLRPGLAHGIDQAGLERGGLFLRNALARSP
ncbi:MAG TPA: prolyl oligopeptidase family serine peptidase [Stellaceae bacterium]|nr:prolyl oligopeptidase family serine peptidase [Stellaceae bacterium]